MNKEDVCLLITGSVSPTDGICKLSLVDAHERRRQYIDSLRFYIEKSKFSKIVFCDNSMAEKDTGLESCAQKYSKQFEWLSFQGNTTLAKLQGKGYGEGEIIEYALNNSQILPTCKSFIKITGRLIVKNINWFLYLSIEKCYFDVRSKLINTRCYFVNKKIYISNFKDAYKKVNDWNGYYLEHSFFDVYMKNPKLYNRMPFMLNFIGQSGSTGIEYQDQKGKIYCLSVIRFIQSHFDF